MHVLELSDIYPTPRLPTAGVFVERQVRELARHVAVDVVSPVPWAPRVIRPLSARWRAYGEQPRAITVRGVPVHLPRYIQPPGQWSMALAGVTMALAAWPVVSRVAAERGVEVIHAHRLLPAGLAGVLLGRRLGRPVVCTLRGTDAAVVPFHDRVARAATRVVAREARALVAVNGNLLESLERVAPVHAPAFVVPNGVDTAQFRPHDRSAARRTVGLDADAEVVLYAGMLVACKGLDVLLDAFARVAASRPRATLVLVGGSPDRNDLASTLRRRAAAIGRIRFVGPRGHDEMPLWFSAADVFALASRREGFPNVVREAIACGTPCVATALPGMADAVGPECGLIVPPDDPAALAAALDEALRRPWDRGAIRRRALAWRWERNAEATLAVLRDAAGRRPAEVA